MSVFYVCRCGTRIEGARPGKNACRCGTEAMVRKNGDVGYQVMFRPGSRPRTPGLVFQDGKLRPGR